MLSGLGNYIVIFYRLAAFTAGVGWFVSILANIVNGSTVFEYLSFISSEEFDYHPMLDYWMKMASLAFALIGIGFLYCSWKWKETIHLGFYLGIYQIVSALSVLLTMSRIELSSQIYLVDFLFFLGTGIPMVWGGLKLKSSTG